MPINNLLTRWGTDVPDKPLQEYPRPQFVRKSYINLNGLWDYAIFNKDVMPVAYEGKILVPFSPESQLSGVGRMLQPKQILFYRTFFTLPKAFVKDLVLLHFGAVDCVCDVFVNGRAAGHHEGGYTAFSVDITEFLREQNNELVVKVRDATERGFYSRGKQALKRGGMWYTAQSGIWQTVWLESVPAQYIADVRITPDVDKACVTIEPDCNFDEPITAIVYDGDEEVAKSDGKGSITLHFPQGKFKFWSPESPFLYGVKLISRRDYVESYFGMRKFSCEKVGESYRLLLNNKPYFHNGLLDQGYWSDGLYTAPDDEALTFDITAAKNLGYNMLRMHGKIECARWYYHCDRLGMLVWQDMPSGGGKVRKLKTMVLPYLGCQKLRDKPQAGFSRRDETGRDQFANEYAEMLSQLYNSACVAVWVPFNEGWGQFDALQIAQFTRDMDATRLVDHASGWHDQGGGDIRSLHAYFRQARLRLPKDDRRAVCITEFGGYALPVDRHVRDDDRCYGYKKFDTPESLQDAIEQLYDNIIIPNVNNGLCAAVYTQLSDVEDELNGLMTFDRSKLKVNADRMRQLNKKIGY